MNRWNDSGKTASARPSRRWALAALAAGLLTTAAADAATRIYRTVDEDGNVVFTDVPPKESEQGQAVDLEGGNTFSPPEPATEGRTLQSWLGTDAEDADADEAAAPVSYRSLQVASPADDEALRDNAGNVTVTAQVDPELDSRHTMQVYLDGQLLQSGPTTSFQLTNVDRGTHRVELRIVDAGGNVLVASEPTVFHLQRRSVILQPAGGRSG